jgi:uncharacterized membrane protein
MGMFLTLAYLFFIGSILGWCLELVFRKFFSSANPEHKWINPGFCVGPYVPLYGFGLCILFLLAYTGQTSGMDQSAKGKAIMFIFMAISMTAIEYIAGILCLKIMKVRLWDYTGLWGNIQGLICPLFSAAWALMGAVYYFFVHPYILDALIWLSNNLAFSFVIGFFFGVFTIDVVYSANLLAKVKKFADENDVIVKYENLKAEIRSAQDRAAKRVYFIFAFRTDRTIVEHLRESKRAVEKIRNIGEKIQEIKAK